MSPEAYETLLTDVTDGIALVTINRPEVRNAVNRQVQLDIRAALTELRDDNTVRVVVFTGAGEKALVAGADIAEVRQCTMHTALASDCNGSTTRWRRSRSRPSPR